MKITNEQLKRIIKEELEIVLSEDHPGYERQKEKPAEKEVTASARANKLVGLGQDEMAASMQQQRKDATADNQRAIKKADKTARSEKQRSENIRMEAQIDNFFNQVKKQLTKKLNLKKPITDEVFNELMKKSKFNVDYYSGLEKNVESKRRLEMVEEWYKKYYDNNPESLLNALAKNRSVLQKFTGLFGFEE